MNDYFQKLDLQAAVKPRFKGHDVLHCKTVPKYPDSAEREYVRMSNQFMCIINDVMRENMPKAISQVRLDSDDEEEVTPVAVLAALDAAFQAMEKELADRLTKFGLRKKLESFAHMTRKLTVKEWKRAVKATLGIDIMEDYYNGAFFKRAIEEWIDYNVGLIVTMPQASLGKMKDIVREGFLEGKRTKDITREIQDEYSRSKRHAQLLARDQVSKLDGQLEEAQQRDAGVREYVWSTAMDSRVRDSHRMLHGKKYSWDDPPDVGGGRRRHPHQDYQCRCKALPVFNLDGVELPWEKGLNDFVTIGNRHMDIPKSGQGLKDLAKELGISQSGTDQQIKDRIIVNLKSKGWKHI